MVLEAEKTGRIKPGDTLIEPTSGNTGIGLALAAAVRGYQAIITMPEKMSQEKQVVLEALGARIIRTPSEASFDAPESHISVAKRLQQELPNAHILDQYANSANPDAHYETTAQEIIKDLGGKVDMVVVGVGTGGTISGIARRLKEHNPRCLIVGADPVGSLLANDDDPISAYKVEGIGYDFVPDVLKRSLVDRWVKTTDQQSFLLARRLIREEGLLCGGSAGSALSAALKEVVHLPKGSNCVVILADGVRNYMSKFVDDKWMRDNQFSNPDILTGTVGDFATSQKPLVTLDLQSSCKEAIKIMRENGFSQLPIIDSGCLVGMLFEADILAYLLSQHENPTPKVSELMNRQVVSVTNETPLTALQQLLLNANGVVVVNEKRRPIAIVTKIDLVEWITRFQ
jgi:cystathionine beta-synthase